MLIEILLGLIDQGPELGVAGLDFFYGIHAGCLVIVRYTFDSK